MAIEALGKIYQMPTLRGSGMSAPIAGIATGSKAITAAETLLQAMQDTSAPVRAQAVWSFARVGRICGTSNDPVRNLVENDPDQKVRIAAISALCVGWPEDQRNYTLLLHRLSTVGEQVEHAHIGWAISALDAPPFEVLPALLDALSSDDWVLRIAIPTAIGKLGAQARSALPALAQIARAELDEEGQFPAIEAIRSIDPDSPQAQALIEPLARMLRDSQSEIQRQNAMFLLMGFGRSAQAAVGTLRDALKSANPDVRNRAVSVLLRIGPAAASAVADLELLVREDPDLNVRRVAEDAWRKIKALMPVNSVEVP